MRIYLIVYKKSLKYQISHKGHILFYLLAHGMLGFLCLPLNPKYQGILRHQLMRIIQDSSLKKSFKKGNKTLDILDRLPYRIPSNIIHVILSTVESENALWFAATYFWIPEFHCPIKGTCQDHSRQLCQKIN